MNFYSLAAKANRKINADAENYMRMGIYKSYGEAYEKAKEMQLNTVKENCKLGIEIMLIYKSIATDMGLIGNKLKQHFFITVRPNPIDVTFTDFYNKVLDFTKRKCFMQFKLAFEQKGKCLEDLGKGFHVHIIGHMTQRSKGEVLVCTKSTFKNMASANCIQVDILHKNDDLERVTRYIEEWYSEDGHKMETKEWDELWRKNMGLCPTYTAHLPAIKSELAGVNKNFTIEFL